MIPVQDELPPEAELPAPVAGHGPPYWLTPVWLAPVWLAPVWLAPVWLAVAGCAPAAAASWSTGAGWSGTTPLADFSSQFDHY